MLQRYAFLAAILACSFVTSTATFIALAASGSSVRINVVDQDGAAVSGAVVMLRPADGATQVATAVTNPVMVQRDTLFDPFILAVGQGQTVTFTNEDDVRHHVYSFSDSKQFDLRLFGKREDQEVAFEAPGIVPVGCNIHDNMLAFIYVTDAPFYATTTDTGEVVMADIPAGRFEVVVWHIDQENDGAPLQIDTTSGDVSGETVTLSLASDRQEQEEPRGRYSR